MTAPDAPEVAFFDDPDDDADAAAIEKVRRGCGVRGFALLDR